MRQLSFEDRLVPGEDWDEEPGERGKRRRRRTRARRPRAKARAASRWSTLRALLARLRWPGRRLALRGGGAALVLAAAIYLAIGSNATHLIAGIGDGLAALGAEAGFTVQNVYAEGRRAVPAARVLKELRTGRGAPLLAFNAAAARRRLEALDWIKSATVERRLPDTIVVRIVERQPLAIWQHDGRLALIDREGTVFGADDVARYGHLPLVVGDGAPAEAPHLFDAIAAEPRLFKRVVSAIWIGGRRWNIRFDSGLEARLPEGDVAAAWARLGELVFARELFDRPVAAVDLRLIDRTVIRMKSKPPPSNDKSDQGTT
jgi:cell division protein FtsQ